MGREEVGRTFVDGGRVGRKWERENARQTWIPDGKWRKRRGTGKGCEKGRRKLMERTEWWHLLAGWLTGTVIACSLLEWESEREWGEGENSRISNGKGRSRREGEEWRGEGEKRKRTLRD